MHEAEAEVSCYEAEAEAGFWPGGRGLFEDLTSLLLTRLILYVAKCMLMYFLLASGLNSCWVTLEGCQQAIDEMDFVIDLSA